MTDAPPLEIRRATPSDAGAVAAFGARIFRDTFGPDNTAEDMDAYLAKAFGPAQQAAELADPDGVTLLAMDAGEIAACAQLRRGAPPAFVPGAAHVEIRRFYVDRPHHGAGLAQRMMDAAFATGREMGGETVWLGVWEHNPRAIAFYRKRGFADVGAVEFVLGSDVQTDRVMARSLSDG